MGYPTSRLIVAALALVIASFPGAKFFLQAQPITITFVRNAAGAVTHLLLVQGGTETRAAKVK